MAELGVRAIARPALGDWLAPAIGTAIFAAVLLKGPAVLGDPDIQWHIETGRWIALHGRVPLADPFSHSMPDAPWHAHEWLAELVFWWIFRLGGWTGVAITAAAAAGLSFGLLALLLRRHLQPRHVVLLCAAAFALASQHLLARPHVLAWPILVLWAHALSTAADRQDAPHAWWLPLMALWANLHGGYVFGLGLAALFAVEALWRAPAPARRSLLARWGVFLFGSAVAGSITPNGPVAGLRFAFGFLDGGGFIAPIGEWQPADLGALSGLKLVLLAMLALALLGRLQLPPFRVALLVALIQLALSHVRHGELLGLVGPLVVAAPLGLLLAGAGAEPAPPSAGRRAWSSATLILTLAVAIGAASLAGPAGLRPPPAVAPAAALAAARAAEVEKLPVLNSFDFGGFLIASGVPVFIDGRADFYGAAFLDRYLKAVSLSRSGTLERLLEEHGIGWTMLQPGTPAILLLDRMPGWARLHADETAVVHRRLAGPAPQNSP